MLERTRTENVVGISVADDISKNTGGGTIQCGRTSILNGLEPANFSPLFLLLSSFQTSQQVKITDVTRVL